MAVRAREIWRDSEGDSLDVIFDQKPGYFRETQNDQVMDKVNEEGNVLRTSRVAVNVARQRPISGTLEHYQTRNGKVSGNFLYKTVNRINLCNVIAHRMGL